MKLKKNNNIKHQTREFLEKPLKIRKHNRKKKMIIKIIIIGHTSWSRCEEICYLNARTPSEYSWVVQTSIISCLSFSRGGDETRGRSVTSALQKDAKTAVARLRVRNARW